MPASARPRRRGTGPLRVGAIARIDLDRERRTGAPEIVLGEGKRPEELVEILRALRDRGVSALVSRPTPAQQRAVDRAARTHGLEVHRLAGGALLRLGKLPGGAARRGPVALFTAGTSDISRAEEAEAVLRASGVRTLREYDVGVAGLHRLLAAVARTERRRPLAYVAFAGREGALPTVLAGLVRAPVIGVPTSVGYGRGARGEGALTAMLQSCAPVAVVNVDAAVPAALFALQLVAGAERRSATTRR